MRFYLLLTVLFSVTFSMVAPAASLPYCQTACKCIPVRCGFNGSCTGYAPTDCCPGNKNRLQYCNYIGTNQACIANGISAHCALFCDNKHDCGR